MEWPDFPLADDIGTLPALPGWITSARGRTPENCTFLSGAALAQLHLVLARDEVPRHLLRDRLALRAAEACMKVSGRPERAGDLRDAFHLLRPGDLPGPAGETYLSWRRMVERPVSVKALHRALPELEAATITGQLDAGKGAPVTRAATVLEGVLTEDPRADVPALILADAALTQALGWGHPVPLLAAGLKRGDLRKREDDLRHACHCAVTVAAIAAVRLATDLARRAARMVAVAPKLRAKGAGAAVDLWLTRDTIAPAGLTTLMSDRAARRLCDRLVTLGALREMTGRDTFRLYGL